MGSDCGILSGCELSANRTQRKIKGKKRRRHTLVQEIKKNQTKNMVESMAQQLSIIVKISFVLFLLNISILSATSKKKKKKKTVLQGISVVIVMGYQVIVEPPLLRVMYVQCLHVLFVFLFCVICGMSNSCVADHILSEK